MKLAIIASYAMMTTVTAMGMSFAMSGGAGNATQEATASLAEIAGSRVTFADPVGPCCGVSIAKPFYLKQYLYGSAPLAEPASAPSREGLPGLPGLKGRSSFFGYSQEPATSKAEPPTSSPVTPTPAPSPTPAAPKRPPTLDELLGLAPAGEDGASDDLKKKLAEEDPGDLFAEAISLMESSSRRLDDGKDTGLETQRTQEDTLRKLDQLISQMQKKQQQQQQQKQQQQQQNKDSKRDQQQQQQQQNQQQQQDAQQTMNPDQAVNSPARRNGALRPGLEAAKAAWGALPARIREMLLQGSDEKFSTTYERQTEEYYRKLAEQK